MCLGYILGVLSVLGESGCMQGLLGVFECVWGFLGAFGCVPPPFHTTASVHPAGSNCGMLAESCNVVIT